MSDSSGSLIEIPTLESEAKEEAGKMQKSFMIFDDETDAEQVMGELPIEDDSISQNGMVLFSNHLAPAGEEEGPEEGRLALVKKLSERMGGDEASFAFVKRLKGRVKGKSRVALVEGMNLSLDKFIKTSSSHQPPKSKMTAATAEETRFSHLPDDYRSFPAYNHVDEELLIGDALGAIDLIDWGSCKDIPYSTPSNKSAGDAASPAKSPSDECLYMQAVRAISTSLPIHDGKTKETGSSKESTIDKCIYMQDAQPTSASLPIQSSDAVEPGRGFKKAVEKAKKAVEEAKKAAEGVRKASAEDATDAKGDNTINQPEHGEVSGLGITFPDEAFEQSFESVDSTEAKEAIKAPSTPPARTSSLPLFSQSTPHKRGLSY